MQAAIGFSTVPRNAFSSGIRAATKSRWSHMFIRYYHPRMRKDVVLEAGVHGDREELWDTHMPNEEYEMLVPPAPVNEDAGLEFASEHLGRTYDWGSMLGRGLAYLAARFGWKIKNPFGNPFNDVCCELGCKYLVGIGALPHSFLDEETTPESVYRYLLAQAWTMEPQGAEPRPFQLSQKSSLACECGKWQTPVKFSWHARGGLKSIAALASVFMSIAVEYACPVCGETYRSAIAVSSFDHGSRRTERRDPQ